MFIFIAQLVGCFLFREIFSVRICHGLSPAKHLVVVHPPLETLKCFLFCIKSLFITLSVYQVPINLIKCFKSSPTLSFQPSQGLCHRNTKLELSRKHLLRPKVILRDIKAGHLLKSRQPASLLILQADWMDLEVQLVQLVIRSVYTVYIKI